jgi:septal ring-binding cell division protein DamX
MNYEFSLNKTAVVSVVAGAIVFGILLFASGLIVGAQWLGTSEPLSGAIAKNEQDEGPTEPVLNDEEPAPKRKAAPQKDSDQKEAPAKEPAPGGEPENVPTATAQEVAANGGIQIIEEAATDANGDALESEPEYVTVQVGAFLDQEEANRLLKNIERKGYAPSFFSGRDAEARQWYAVRIGAYSDRQQAANAAANFTRQEKVKAVVRPVGSL